MTFSQFFADYELNEGKRLWQKGYVGTPVENAPGQWVVPVGLFPRYTVRLQLRNNILTAMGCSCFSAASGKRCAHEAAALFALEQQQMHPASGSSRARQKRVTPFARMPSGYQYFNFPELTRNLVIYEDTYNKAQQLFESGALLSHTTGKTHDFGTLLHFHTCEFRVPGNPQPDTVSIYYDENSLFFRSDCGCSVTDENTPCVHRVAALIALYDSLTTYSGGDATDENGLALLESFRSVSAPDEHRLSEEKTPVFIQPSLTMTDQDGKYCLNIDFRTGISRLLKVRHPVELIDAFRNNAQLVISKTLTLDFSAQTYTGKDLDTFNLLRDLVSESVTDEGPSDTFPLTGSVLDSFFDLYKGDTVPFRSSESDAESLTLAGGEPRLKLRLTPLKEKGVLHGIHLEGPLAPLFTGSRHLYTLAGSSLFRLPDENAPLAALLKSADNRPISLDIGRDNLPRFYRTILPALRLCADIEETAPEEISQILPPEPTFTFYLDLAGSRATCQTKLTYGDQVCFLNDADRDDLLLEPFRDVDAEKSLLRLIRTYFPVYTPETKEHATDGSEEALYTLLTQGISALDNAGELMATKAFDKVKVRPRAAVNIGVSVSGGMTNLTVKSDLSNEELLQVLHSYREKKKYHRLDSGDFLPLDESVASLAEVQDGLRLPDRALLAGQASLPAFRALYADRLLEECTDLTVERSSQLRQMSRDFKTVNDADFDVPASFRGTLRPYQLYGYKWLRTLEHFSFGGILADDMGLGKTVQVIAFLLSAKEEGRLIRALVACPASVVYNWQEELARFAPGLTCTVVSGTNRAQLIGAGSDVLITSFDTLRRDIDLYEKLSFSHQIVDEAQNIKNQSTAAAKAVKSIQASFRLAMTGTPIENRLSELWSIFDYLMPGYLYSYESFRREYETPIAKSNDETARRRLRAQVSPFILRRMKKDVLTDLPDKTEITRYAVMEDIQRNVYDARVMQLRRSLEQESDDDFHRNKLQVLSELTKLRQLCCDPALLLEDYNGSSAKREECMRLVETAIDGGHRMLLFSQFTSMLDILARELERRGIPYFTITGDTPKDERLRLVNEFNAGYVPVFLISLKAGGTGLNLVGADTVIHFDPWWNIAAQNQASDRIYRIGQKKDVTVYKLIARDTIEEKIQQLQEKKQQLADSVLDDESGLNLSAMTREELLALFEPHEKE